MTRSKLVSSSFLLILVRFLWVYFQIEEICAQTTDDDIRRVVPSLPKDLPETYERALSRVVKNRKANLAIKMFGWVAAAKRPLSLTELREAIGVEQCQPFSKPGQLVNDIDQMVPWCGNMLVLDEEQCLVQYAHHSVKEYLLIDAPDSTIKEFHFRHQDADHEAGEICCTYLQFNDFKRQ